MAPTPLLRHFLLIWGAIIGALALAYFGYAASACQSVDAAITKMLLSGFVYVLVFPLRCIAGIVITFALAYLSTPFLIRCWPMTDLLMRIALLVASAGILAHLITRMSGVRINCLLRY